MKPSRLFWIASLALAMTVLELQYRHCEEQSDPGLAGWPELENVTAQCRDFR